MANVSFHVGTSAPGTSGLTTDGLYFNRSGGGIYYATSTTAHSEVASKVSATSSYSSGRKIGSVTINGSAKNFYLGLDKGWKMSTSGETLATIISNYDPSFICVYLSSTTMNTLSGGLIGSASTAAAPAYLLFHKRIGGGAGHYIAQCVVPYGGWVSYYLTTGSKISANYTYIGTSDNKLYSGSVANTSSQAATLLATLNSNISCYSLF